MYAGMGKKKKKRAVKKTVIISVGSELCCASLSSFAGSVFSDGCCAERLVKTVLGLGVVMLAC